MNRRNLRSCGAMGASGVARQSSSSASRVQIFTLSKIDASCRPIRGLVLVTQSAGNRHPFQCHGAAGECPGYWANVGTSSTGRLSVSPPPRLVELVMPAPGWLAGRQRADSLFGPKKLYDIFLIFTETLIQNSFFLAFIFPPLGLMTFMHCNEKYTDTVPCSIQAKNF